MTPKTRPMYGNEASQAKQIRDSIFQSLDPFDAPIAKRLQIRALFFPVDLAIDREQFNAIGKAATCFDENACYLHYLDVEAGGFADWIVEFGDYEGFVESTAWSRTHALYSQGGRWGVLISEEDHAVAGSNDEFIAVLRSTLPARTMDFAAVVDHRLTGEVTDDPQVQEFFGLVKTWASWKADLSWLPGLLDHIYGADNASGLIHALKCDGVLE